MDTFIVYKSPFPKKRIGPPYDGGYVICDIPGKYDGFISGGVGVNIEFERHFLSVHHDMTCIAFDGTVQGLPYYVPGVQHIKRNLGNTIDEETTTLSPYMKNVTDVFMKIDIEGHEFKLLPTLFANGDINKVKQLVLEIHTPNDIARHPVYYGDSLKYVTNDVMFDVLSELNKTHVLVHVHGNNIGTYDHDGILMPRVIECTYLRKADYPSIEWVRSDEAVPSEHDYPNGQGAPDIVLRGYPFNTLE
jgi:hypothetical protein